MLCLRTRRTFAHGGPPGKATPGGRRSPGALARRALGFGAAALVPAVAWAHGDQPQVRSIAFPPQLDGAFMAVTDVQGVFVDSPGGVRWLCEDAVRPNAGFIGLTPVGDDARTWLVATVFGVHKSKDGGCSFEAVGGDAGRLLPLAFLPRPGAPDEVVVATRSPNATNDVFRTVDAGRSWQAAGLAVDGAVRTLIRAEAEPGVLYVSHTRGAGRSDDGGASFQPMDVSVDDVQVRPEDVYLLGTLPDAADVVFAAVARLPASLILRSDDAGGRWRVVAQTPDVPTALVFDRAGRRARLLVPPDALWRSVDGGETFQAAPVPVPTLGCLRRDVATDRLWGCANVFLGGPFLAGTSDDFGDTWAPHLAGFGDVTERWVCPPESPAARNCEGLCPGRPVGATCADGGVGPPADAAPPPVDAGREADAGTDAALADAGPATDAGPAPDQGPVEADHGAVDAAVVPPDALAPDATPPLRGDDGGAGCGCGFTRDDGSGRGPVLVGAGLALGLWARRSGRRRGGSRAR